MRRWNTYQHVNQNGTVGNHFNSNEGSPDSLSPEIVMGQMWLQDTTTQVEIIELDSDDAEIPHVDKQERNFQQYWNYVDRDRFAMPEPEIYRANKRAREKRRMMENSNYDRDKNSPENFENEFAEVVNDIVYSSFYGSTNDVSDKKKSRQANCFTIVNKPFKSDSSSDEMEFIDHTDESNHVNGDMPYDGEIITFDQDEETNKHTIWIYSFRNKRLLSDNDFELVNIPSQDSASSTSCSLDNFCDESNMSKSTSRVSSPIPASYVPRLNLSMATTLPTVTEITEPTTTTDKITKSTCPTNRQKSINNWCAEKVTTNSFINHVDKYDKSSNTHVINWMSLSPRERRRRSRRTKSSPTYESKLPALIEVPTTDQKSNESLSENARTIQTVAEICVVGYKIKDAGTASPPKCVSPSIKCDTIIVTDVNDKEQESGDFKKKLLQKPQINIDSVSYPKRSIITDPIEKLESNHWILEDKKMTQSVFDTSESEILEIDNTISDKSGVVCAGDKLWSRNMSLLKPAAWAEFMPITDSVPSLHLTIDSDNNKESWIKRLAKCFRCFKSK